MSPYEYDWLWIRLTVNRWIWLRLSRIYEYMNMIECKYDCIWTWLNMNTSIWIKVWISNNVLWLILHTRNEGKRSSAIWSVCEALITRALHNREGQNPEPRHHVGGEVPKDMDMRSFQFGVWIFNYSNINRASIISIGLEHDFRCAGAVFRYFPDPDLRCWL